MSDLEARIAEVLHVHRSIPAHDGPGMCHGCNWESRRIGVSSAVQHREHVSEVLAAMLAPAIREREVAAWDACVREADNRWHIGHASAAKLRADNHYRSNDE